MGDYWRALDQRIPEGDGASETVKEGKRGKETIFRSGIEDDGKLRDVADEIMMRKNHTLGFTRTAAGKKQDRFFVSALAWKPEPAS